MPDQTHILQVEQDSHDGLWVTFSDGTRAGFVVEELLMLRPLRETVRGCGDSDNATTIVMKFRFPIGASDSA
jgi:hypothetical protein